MGGNASDTLGHIAGYGVGALSALTSIKGGGLQNWLLNRQRAIEDPAIRASLIGSPFASGMLFQGGGDVAAPGTMPAPGGVAAPSDLAWLQQQTPDRRFIPNAPPLPAETQVQVQAAQGIVSGAQSSDPVVRAQAKLAGKIPLTPQEQNAAIGSGVALQKTLGPGGTLGLQIPGMPVTIGSPYSVSPGVGTDEYATFGEAQAYANAHGGAAAGWTVAQTNRGTFKAVQAELPRTPPGPVPATPAPTGAPAAAPATPAPAARRQPGTPPGAIAAPSAAVPPPPPPAPPPPAAPPKPPAAATRPAPAPRPSVQTGTPALTAGQIVIPTAPAAPAYVPPGLNRNAPAPGAAPYAPPPAAAPPAAYPSPAFDDSGATAPPSGGFFSWLGPSAAQAAEVPREPVPEYRPAAPPPLVVAPPVAPQRPGPGAAPVAVEPQTAGAARIPISGVTTGPGGSTYSYDVGKAASELASDMADAGITDFRTSTDAQRAKFNQLRTAREQRSLVSAADTQRMLRPANTTEAQGTSVLMGYRSATDKFLEDFPDAAERDQYIGLVNRPLLDVASVLHANPRFALFTKDLARLQGFEGKRDSLTDAEYSDLSDTIPTGRESHAEYFEQNLLDFRQRLNEELGLRLALQNMPVGQQTAAWANQLRAQWAEERAQSKTADVMAAMGLGAPAAAAPPPGGETPPTITVAPTTTTTSQPPTTTSLPPLVIYGHSPLY